MSVLREVKYLDLNQDEIPQIAANIFAQKELYRKYVANLDLTEQWYNKVEINIAYCNFFFLTNKFKQIRSTILEVEYPLIEDQLSEIDAELKKAETDIKWKDDGSIEKLL